MEWKSTTNKNNPQTYSTSSQCVRDEQDGRFADRTNRRRASGKVCFYWTKINVCPRKALSWVKSNASWLFSGFGKRKCSFVYEQEEEQESDSSYKNPSSGSSSLQSESLRVTMTNCKNIKLSIWIFESCGKQRKGKKHNEPTKEPTEKNLSDTTHNTKFMLLWDEGCCWWLDDAVVLGKGWWEGNNISSTLI